MPLPVPQPEYLPDCLIADINRDLSAHFDGVCMKHLVVVFYDKERVPVVSMPFAAAIVTIVKRRDFAISPLNRVVLAVVEDATVITQPLFEPDFPATPIRRAVAALLAGGDHTIAAVEAALATIYRQAGRLVTITRIGGDLEEQPPILDIIGVDPIGTHDDLYCGITRTPEGWRLTPAFTDHAGARSNVQKFALLRDTIDKLSLIDAEAAHDRAQKSIRAATPEERNATEPCTLRYRRWDGIMCILCRADGSPVSLGDTLMASDDDVPGAEYTVTGGAAPHKAAATGMVYVTRGKTSQGLYPFVFDCTWQPERVVCGDAR